METKTKEEIENIKKQIEEIKEKINDLYKLYDELSVTMRDRFASLYKVFIKKI